MDITKHVRFGASQTQKFNNSMPVEDLGCLDLTVGLREELVEAIKDLTISEDLKTKLKNLMLGLRDILNEIKKDTDCVGSICSCLDILKKNFKQRLSSNNEKLLGKKRKREHTQNLTAFYEGITKKQAENKITEIKNRLNNHKIFRKDNSIQVEYKFSKKSNFTLESKILMIENESPIDIFSTAPKEKINRNWVYEIKEKDTIYGASTDNNAPKPFRHLIEEMKKITKGSKEISLNEYATWIKEEIKSIDAEFNTEATLLSVILPEIQIKAKDGSLKLIGIEHGDSENIENFNLNFRSDVIFLIDSTLVIIETKYDSDRSNQAREALATIDYKAYTARQLNHLRYNKPNIYRKIERVIEIGVGMTTKNGISTDILFFMRNIRDVDLKSYKSELFAKEMKKNSHRNISKCLMFLEKTNTESELIEVGSIGKKRAKLT